MTEVKRKKSGKHLHRRLVWRPTDERQEAIRVWAQQRGLGRLTDAMDELIDAGLATLGEELPPGPTREVHERLDLLLEEARDLWRGLEEIARRLDVLGTASYATNRLVAFWIAANPAHAPAGVGREEFEGQLLREFGEMGREIWGLCRPDEPADSASDERRLPIATDLRALLDELVGKWRGRGGRTRAVELRERVSAWSAEAGYPASVGSLALLELGLTVAESRTAVPAWAVSELKHDLAAIATALERTRGAVDRAQRLLDLAGQAVAFLPNLLAQWAAEDPDLYRYAGGQAEPEALELMLRELFWEEGERVWTGILDTYRDNPSRQTEGAPE